MKMGFAEESTGDSGNKALCSLHTKLLTNLEEGGYRGAFVIVFSTTCSLLLVVALGYLYTGTVYLKNGLFIDDYLVH